MKVVFNGLLERKGGRGCNCRKSGSDYRFVQQRMYILPSGLSKTFYTGKVAEVSEKDGQFLLSYTYTDKNGTHSVFTKVEDE